MKTKYAFYLLALAFLTANVACKDSKPAEGVEAPAKAEEEPVKTAEEEPAKEGHGHGGHAEGSEGGEEAEASDLDLPVEKLKAMMCEHNIKTYECEECRYETGFVKVPAALVEDGLVKTFKVESRKVAVPVTLTGEVQFDERRIGHVRSLVEGIVRKVNVALGDKVKKGQPLLEIDSVAVGEARTASLEARGLLRLATQNFDRVSALRKENISSDKEFLAAKQELEAAQIRADGALGRLVQLGMDAGEARSSGGSGNTGRLVIRAPIDGTVLVMHVVSGEVPGIDEPLITVGDNSTVWVWADLYERDIAAIKGAQADSTIAATVSVRAYPGVEFEGNFDLVSPVMNESSRTVKVRVAANNPDGRLLAGMFATVNLYLPGDDQSLAVPRDAVFEDEGRQFVFIHHEGDYFVRRPVTVGRSWAGWVEIKAGLQSGQTVVAEGGFLMKSDVLRSKMGAGCAD